MELIPSALFGNEIIGEHELREEEVLGKQESFNRTMENMRKYDPFGYIACTLSQEIEARG
jgi:hypothetical protein